MEICCLFTSTKKKTNEQKHEEMNNSNNNKDTTFSLHGFLRQFLAGISIYILSINHGIHAAWTSPALPFLVNRTSYLTISEEEGAWIASIPSFGIIFGILACSFLLDRIGRKYTLLLSTVPHLLSWILIILAKNYLTLFIARFISGIGSGLTYSAASLYIGEIAAKEIRGILITILNLSSNLGTLFVVLIGAFYSYETMNIIMLCIPFLAFLMFLFTPKSPYFSLMKDKENKAIKTLMELRSLKDIEAVHAEIERIKEAVKESQNTEKTSLKELFNKGNRKGLVILLFAKAAMYLSGVAAIEAYTESILSRSNFSLHPKHATIVLGVVRILASLSYTLYVDRARKIMFLISGILSALALASVGLFFFLDSQSNFDVSSITWLPLVGLVSYLIFCNMGLVSMPIIFMGELFSINAKSNAVGLAVILSASFVFISKFWFQKLESAFGLYMPFWIFSLCCIISVIIVHLISPDTAGKNLEEVQNILKQKKEKLNFTSDGLELSECSKYIISNENSIKPDCNSTSE